MANKRMFSCDVVDSDDFYDLPFNSQLLYFHLGMHADVRGFIQPKKVIRAIGLKIEDLKPLIQHDFVIPFESGVVIITHWNVNNNTRLDREAPTRFINELSIISEHNNEYLLLQEDSRSTPAQIRLDKIRLEERTPTKTAKPFCKISDITPEVLSEISEKYNVSLEDVENTFDDMILWHGAKTKNRYQNYKLALMKWVKRAKAESSIKSGSKNLKPKDLL